MLTERAELSIREIHELYLETLGNLRLNTETKRNIPLIQNQLSSRMEHTLLRADATEKELEKLCEDARTFQFRGVCVTPSDVRFCARKLEGSAALVVSVVDFPLGKGTPGTAAYQARRVVDEGAAEVDMVVDVRAILQGELEKAATGIARVVEAAGCPVKVILETGYLSESMLVQGCAVSFSAGAAFIKTSTGYGKRGASVRDIQLMRAAVGQSMHIKASGGIRDAAFARALVAAGADVVGTSNGPACIQ